MHVIKATIGGLKSVLTGSRYHEDDYVDLLKLLYALIRLITRKGTMAIESHIENPKESSIFKEHPKLLQDSEVVLMICDYFRMIGMDADDPHQVEDVMGRELKKTLVEKMHPVHALQGVADALPALGIIAAVLGVIKTMSHINEPPAILGEMIGGALVGTFLGVLLAYGLMGPIAARLKQVVEEDARFLEVIRAILVSHLHGNPPQISIETGRKMVPNEYMPTFASLEATLESTQ
jgi:chemotaxis protein MotA